MGMGTMGMGMGNLDLPRAWFEAPAQAQEQGDNSFDMLNLPEDPAVIAGGLGITYAPTPSSAPAQAPLNLAMGGIDGAAAWAQIQAEQARQAEQLREIQRQQQMQFLQRQMEAAQQQIQQQQMIAQGQQGQGLDVKMVAEGTMAPDMMSLGSQDGQGGGQVQDQGG
jgi:hypothetical protein